MPAGVSSQRFVWEGIVHEDLCPRAHGNLGRQNNVVPNIHKVLIALKCCVCKSSNLMNLELLLAESPSSSKRHDCDEYGDPPASWWNRLLFLTSRFA